MTRPTPEQARAFPGVLWLLKGDRGSGKTHLLAHALIETAIMEQGRHIYVFDHSVVRGVSPYLAADNMRYIITRLLDEYPEYSFVYNRGDNSLTCLGRRDDARSSRDDSRGTDQPTGGRDGYSNHY